MAFLLLEKATASCSSLARLRADQVPDRDADDEANSEIDSRVTAILKSLSVMAIT